MADVAADEHVVAAGFEHATGQRGGRRLAFRPGDRDDSTAKPSRCEFQLADDVHTCHARGLDRRQGRWHSGAEDDEVRAGERGWVVVTEFEPDAGGPESVLIR